MIRTNVFLTEQQREALKRLAHRNGIPVAVHIRRAIDEYLERRRETNEDEYPEEMLEEVNHYYI